MNGLFVNLNNFISMTLMDFEIQYKKKKTYQLFKCNHYLNDCPLIH
jgi:hypothetical protein